MSLRGGTHQGGAVKLDFHSRVGRSRERRRDGQRPPKRPKARDLEVDLVRLSGSSKGTASRPEKWFRAASQGDGHCPPLSALWRKEGNWRQGGGASPRYVQFTAQGGGGSGKAAGSFQIQWALSSAVGYGRMEGPRGEGWERRGEPHSGASLRVDNLQHVLYLDEAAQPKLCPLGSLWGGKPQIWWGPGPPWEGP